MVIPNTVWTHNFKRPRAKKRPPIKPANREQTPQIVSQGTSGSFLQPVPVLLKPAKYRESQLRDDPADFSGGRRTDQEGHLVKGQGLNIEEASDYPVPPAQENVGQDAIDPDPKAKTAQIL